MDVVFVDLEASGLGAESYPIEIAWKCPESGETDSFLINPDSVQGWSYWDDFAEELHGLDRQQLVAQGLSAKDACERLNARLSGRRLISDALEFDSFWVRRLFEAVGEKARFEVVGLDALLSAEQLIQYRFVARSQFRRHRAMQDVEDLIQAVAAVAVETSQEDD